MQKKKGKEPANSPKFIVKKKISEGDGGHHGGVWKIAYADFMTAMMTFFLVMWLINSSSKEKITALANYFNPVKLTDRNPAKGVRDNETGAASDAKKEVEKAEKSSDKKAEASKAESKQQQQQKSEDELLFNNPFGVLTQLASQAEGAMAVAMSQSNSGSLISGGASHDPFVTDPVMSQPFGRVTQVAAREPADHAPAASARKPEPAADAASAGKQAAPKPEPGAGEPKPETQEAAAQLAKEIARLTDTLPRAFRPSITTKATSEGVLVSLTDDLNFSMFKIASAEPSPQLVLVLDRIGTAISKHPGKLVVRGHTDARKYTGDAHGNWRLSINRANMAYFMLLRAKVEDTRFLAVEGYADRNLRNKSDPLAAENRRIEILIKAAES